MNLPYVKKPCKECPFKKDTLKHWLGKYRISEILKQTSFVCHKKTNLQCSGHMQLLGSKNNFVELADRLNIKLNLIGSNLIFDSESDCIDHHT